MFVSLKASTSFVIKFFNMKTQFPTIVIIQNIDIISKIIELLFSFLYFIRCFIYGKIYIILIVMI